LQDEDRLTLDVARAFRECVLAQSAFDANDAVSPPAKTHALAVLALDLYGTGRRAIAGGRAFEQLDIAGATRAVSLVRWAAAADLARCRDAAAAAISSLQHNEVPGRVDQHG
jgi:vacuolar-type H+-ATPase catalytic subunit A/Vma1